MRFVGLYFYTRVYIINRLILLIADLLRKNYNTCMHNASFFIFFIRNVSDLLGNLRFIMTFISQSLPVPLRATDSSIPPFIGNSKVKDVALSALMGIQAKPASPPYEVTYTEQEESSLGLRGIVVQVESAGLQPKAPVRDEDDDSSDDGFGEFHDPSYQSCMVRESRFSDVEAMSGSWSSCTPTFSLPPFISDRSGRTSDLGLGRKPAVFLSVEKATKAPQDKESMVFQQFQVVSGSFPEELVLKLPLAFASGRVILSGAGKNGSCKIFDEKGNCISIFKPREGELGFRSSAKETKYLRSKEGIEPGEGALSEYISFRVNQMMDLIEIPSTCYVKVASEDRSVKKEGSLHEFIPGARNYADLADDEKALLSKEEVEALAIFDLFIFNADRNGENLLVVNKPGRGTGLIGIDHGCILPRRAQSGGVFCWSELEQVKSPISPKGLATIESLSSNPLRTLREELVTVGFEGVSLESFYERLLTQEASIHMLKHGAHLGLSLSEIARFCQDCPPAINPLHKIITSSQKDGTSEKAVIIEIQGKVENLLGSYLVVKTELREDPAMRANDLDKISAEKTVSMLNLYMY